jgi:hypothetical protein
MNRSLAVAVVVAVALQAAPSALRAQSAREAVYFTTPNNRISRALFDTGAAETVVTDPGTNLNGLAARYDGNGRVTLLVANATQGGDIRAYSCPSATAACEKLGVVASLKHANGVALDTLGNLWAVNGDRGGADRLLRVPRALGCPTDVATGLPANCRPGGYGPAEVVAAQVPGVSLLADVEVVPGSGDVIVLASKPAKLLRYSAGTWSEITSAFDGQTPSGLALFPTGEIFVVTTQGSVFVFDGSARNTFTTLDGQGQQIAIGVEGGAAADPVTNGRVLVTVKSANQVQSFGIQRNGGLVASASVPDGTVAANVPFGIGDASLSGSVYTAASPGPVTVALPTGHGVTFSKVNAGGITQGSYYIVPEAAVRNPPALAHSTACPDGQITLEGVTRCVPAHVRGYPLGETECAADGTGCYYLVYVADTGADVFGGTQEHHFEEELFGFETSCYVSDDEGADPHGQQPRTFYATDDNDPAIVEGNDFTDISTGCGSHIGRGAQFSMFIAGWDGRPLADAIEQKIVSIEAALDPERGPSAGGLWDYITDDGQDELTALVEALRETWECEKEGGPAEEGADYPQTLAAIDAIAEYVDTYPVEFSECPNAAASCPTSKRNAPGELIARAESAAFLACGASQDCQRTLPAPPIP